MKLILSIIFYKGSPPEKLKYCPVCKKYKPENEFIGHKCIKCKKQKPVKKLMQINNIVSSYFKIKRNTIYQNTNKHEVVKYRQIVMYFCTLYVALSNEEIGQLITNKDHSTVSHAKKTVLNLMDSDKKYRSDIENIDKLILRKLKL